MATTDVTSKYLTLKASKSSLGRYWIANEDIPCGTLLIKESPIGCIPNIQIDKNKISDPIKKKDHSFCWNRCCLFKTSESSHAHYCSNECHKVKNYISQISLHFSHFADDQKSSKIMKLLCNPSLAFVQSIKNDSTLRLTLFLTLKMISHCAENNKLSLLTNIDATFQQFDHSPSTFYKIFSSASKQSKMLQCTINDKHICSNKIYKSYLNKLSKIIPTLSQHVSIDISNENLFKLSTYFLNIVFVNGFGAKFSLIHDDDIVSLSLFVNASFFNHSCAPNAFYHFSSGNQIIVRTLRPISKNEMITIAIVDDLESHSKKERQSMLKTNFGFECLCDRCCDKEYIQSDCFLAQRANEKESVMNMKKHFKLLTHARSFWSKGQIENGWKFYQKLWNEYRYLYHPFDSDAVALMMEISQRAFLAKDYQIGYDAAEMGRQFVERLTSGGIVENCHLKEFKFIFLGFLHYLHLIKGKFPKERVDEMLKMEKLPSQNGVGESENMIDLMNMFAKNDEKEMKNTENEQIETIVVEDDVLSDYKKEIAVIKEEESVNDERDKNEDEGERKYKEERQENGQYGNNEKLKQSKNKKRKEKKNKPKRKKKKKKKKKIWNKEALKDENVQIYTFGNNDDGDDDMMTEMNSCDDMEHQLTDKMTELYATRCVLFPKFKDFEDWIGKDLMLIDERIKTVVDTLKNSFAKCDDA